MRQHRLRFTFAAASLLALAACRDDDRQARIAVPDIGAPGWTVEQPLPDARPAPIARVRADEGYRGAERAYGLQQAFYEEPPAYAFEEAGVEPWVWRTADDWEMYAEPWEGQYRYYFYEPGAAYPYFVRDGAYGFGFDRGGVLVAVFDSAGGYLPYARYAAVAPLAGRYYLRGHDLRRAAFETRRRRPVDAAVWSARAPVLQRSAASWQRVREADLGWRAWRDKAGAASDRPRGREDDRRFRAPAASDARWARDGARRERAERIAAAEPTRHAPPQRGGHNDRRGPGPAASAETHGRFAAATEPKHGPPGPPSRGGRNDRHGRPAASAEAHGRPATAIEPRHGAPARRDFQARAKAHEGPDARRGRPVAEARPAQAHAAQARPVQGHAAPGGGNARGGGHAGDRGHGKGRDKQG